MRNKQVNKIKVILAVIGGVVLLGTVGSCLGGSGDASASSPSPSITATAAPAPDVTLIGAGHWRAGKGDDDVLPGLWQAALPFTAEIAQSCSEIDIDRSAGDVTWKPLIAQGQHPTFALKPGDELTIWGDCGEFTWIDEVPK